MRLPRFLRREAGAEVDRLYRKHADEVLRYAMLVMRSRTDAEDITQTVFLRALRAIERGEKVRTPRNWLIKITHNECRRLLATRKVHIELPDEIAVEPVETGRAEELRVALDALPATQRQALVLRELEGRTYAEISQALDLSESAVETLIFRARRALREQIENAMSCEEFAELLEDPSARARVRAHARVCAPCATLERQARGRKSALKRIASVFGMPWWGAKLGAVALTTAAVTAVAVAVPTPRDGTRPSVPVANVAPTRTLNLVPAPRQLAVVPHSSAAPTNHVNVVPRSSRSKLVASRANSSSPASTATTPTAAGTPPATVTPAAVLPGPEAPAPSAPEPQTPQPEPLPSPTKVVPVTPPVHVPPVAVPAVAVPAVAVPTPPVAVTVPAVSVPQPVLPPVPDPPSVTVPTVSVPSQAPAPPTVTAPVETPKVKLP